MPEDGSLLDRLLDCHARIREMLTLARRMSAEPRMSPEALTEDAERVRRYFRRALRMHVQDEEESILPRLTGAEVRAALERMQREHKEHEARVASLVACCERLADSPDRWEEIRAELGRAAEGLEREMIPHLVEEEQDVFPAIAGLGEAAHSEILKEMQARRDATGGGGGGRGGGMGRRAR